VVFECEGYHQHSPSQRLCHGKGRKLLLGTGIDLPFGRRHQCLAPDKELGGGLGRSGGRNGQISNEYAFHSKEFDATEKITARGKQRQYFVHATKSGCQRGDTVGEGEEASAVFEVRSCAGIDEIGKYESGTQFEAKVSSEGEAAATAAGCFECAGAR
jgi:hypothetical protein